MADLVLQAAIVGQQYQALGVGVQTSGRINIGYMHIVCQTRVLLVRGELADHAEGFIEK